MDKQVNMKKENKVKRILLRFFEQVDKKMQEKAKSSDGCCNNHKSKNKPCCS
jgi:hypothetical protein